MSSGASRARRVARRTSPASARLISATLALIGSPTIESSPRVVPATTSPVATPILTCSVPGTLVAAELRTELVGCAQGAQHVVLSNARDSEDAEHGDAGAGQERPAVACDDLSGGLARGRVQLR